MTYQVRFDICVELLPDMPATLAFLDLATTMYAVHDRRAMTFAFGPADAGPVLRLDVDYDVGRAALRWLPDATYGVELPEAEPIVVMESSDLPVITVPARLARVSVDAAHRAVAEYVTTGVKPASIPWQSSDAGAAAPPS